MTAYGTARVMNITTEVVVKIAGTYTQPELGIRYIADAVLKIFRIGLPILPSAPILGQIWPRGMVGPYRGPEAVGNIRILNLSQDVSPPPSIDGQLWPRGDYIPSMPNT